MQDNYAQPMVNEILGKMNWSEWMYKSALSPQPLNFTTVEGVEAVDLANGFIALNGTGAPDGYINYKSFYTNL